MALQVSAPSVLVPVRIRVTVPIRVTLSAAAGASSPLRIGR